MYLHAADYKAARKTRCITLIRFIHHIRIAEKVDNPLFVPSVVEGESNPTETVSTTVFVSSANEVTSSMTDYKQLDSKLLTNAEISAPQDIVAFLQKPIRIASGNFQTTDTVQGFLGYNLPTTMTALEPYASKLKGFLGMRADIVLRLVVNANRFQAGRYILAFNPVVGAGTDAVSQGAGTRFANLTTITQTPHVEIDLSTETQAVLKIPYVAISSHLPIVPASPALFGLLGEARLFTYSALRTTAGSGTVPWDIYAHFENINLAAPCVPQSGKFVPKQNNISSEQSSQGVGPISGTLKKISKVSNLIGLGIPSLSSLAQPVSWAMDLASEVASVFGWSKPVNLDAMRRVNNHVASYMTNCDVIDNGVPISLYARNQVEIMPGFAGNDLDEMSIDHLKTIPAYVQTIDWTTSAVIGDQLLTLNLRPEFMKSSFASGASTTVDCYTPVGFFTQFFHAWRGGLRVTFKIVKTEFHTGRLSISFNPHQPYQSSAAITLANQPYVHREIIDIRDGTSFDFIVPYTSLTPYKNVGESYGDLCVTVINPLIAPATVSSTISMLVEVSAAPDFEYAIPHAPLSITPAIVYNPQASKFVPTTDVNSIRTSVIGGSSIIHDDDISSRACVGEKVKSILSLMKKYTLSYNTSDVYVQLTPYALKYSGTSVADPTYSGPCDYIDIFSSLFAISRGGVRYKSMPNFSLGRFYSPKVLMKQLRNATLFPSFGYATLQTGHSLANIVIYTTVNNGGAEFQVPQYDNCYARTVAECQSDYVTPGYNTNSITVPNTVITVNCPEATGANQWYHYRAAADDFQLGYFVGIPPVIRGLTNII